MNNSTSDSSAGGGSSSGGGGGTTISGSENSQDVTTTAAAAATLAAANANQVAGGSALLIQQPQSQQQHPNIRPPSSPSQQQQQQLQQQQQPPPQQQPQQSSANIHGAAGSIINHHQQQQHHHHHQQQQQHHHHPQHHHQQQQHHQINQFNGGHHNYYQRQTYQPHQPIQHYHPSHHHQQQQQQQQQHHHLSKYNQRGQANVVNSQNAGGGDNESNVNHVLLITIINPHYPINCDLIHQICSTYGKVNRIVIFKKNGVQAMVEFDNVESAKRAKSSLYGCDIYSGCCTLRIEYAKPTRLNIHRNDNESFDYTNPTLSSGVTDHHQPTTTSTNLTEGTDANAADVSSTVGNHHTSHRAISGHTRGGNIVSGGMQHFQSANQHHHPHHHTNAAGANYGLANPLDQSSASTDVFHQDGGFNVSRNAAGGGGSGAAGAGPNAGYDSYMQTQHGGIYSRQDGHHHHHHLHHSRMNHNHNSSFNSANTSGALMVGPSNLAMQPQGTVMMVYGLQPERVNCDRLFNLFCLYGNVVRIKFLRTKEGCAMVQMGDVLAVDRCVSSLNKITLFGSELQISYSKQAFLHDVIQPYILPDGSPSFKDFMGNKNNRFKNPEVASKNRILPPSQVLHFFSAPYGITEDELGHMFKQTAGHEPISIKIFTPKTDNSKSYSGLATFKDPAEATETLVMCNHLSMPKLGAPHPYILRLCFSPPTYMRPPTLGGDVTAHR